MDRNDRALLERAIQRARALLEGEFREQLEGTYDIGLDGRVAAGPGPHLSRAQRAIRARLVSAFEHKRASGMEAAAAAADLLRDAAFTTLNRFVALKMLEARGVVQECVSHGTRSSGFAEFCGLAPGLPLWAQDETLGWAYQYFNSADERRAMRETQAPQSARELAVRNQFFTPRYVVRFLGDNTLGRLWWEMRGGHTALAERCALLVPPAAGAARPPKDPRDIRVLDPACGSGHFLLYAFDLLLVMYEEAWTDPDWPPWTTTGRTLRAQFETSDELRHAAPALILRHNLHGIDIDRRCVQIAVLSLWMRAQAAFADAGLARGARPPIEKTNLVVAEPMPGDEAMVAEFAASLGVPLGTVFRAVVERMRLAGEAGSLLRIEEDIRDLIRARHGAGGPLFGKADAASWTEAEGRLYAALERYAAEARGAGTRRRLFADDAEEGFAFIDACRQSYDVVLMNPPFGDPTPQGRKADRGELAACTNDMGGAFLLAAERRWGRDALIGLLSSTTLWFKPTVAEWRREALLGERHAVRLAAHLGGDVLDGASVSASAVVVGAPAGPATFFRCLRDADREAGLAQRVAALRAGEVAPNTYVVEAAALARYPGCPLTYWISAGLREALLALPQLEGHAAEIRVGVQTSDDPRFVRAWWEVPTLSRGLGRRWAPFAKSSEYCPYWDDVTWVVAWVDDGREVRAFERSYPRSTEYFGRPGVTFPRRAVLGFNPRAFPKDCGFSDMGSVAFAKDLGAALLLGYLASRPLEYVLSFSNGTLQGRKGAYQNHYEVGQVKALPWPTFAQEQAAEVERLGRDLATTAMRLQDDDETTHQYRGRPGLGAAEMIGAALDRAICARGTVVTEARALRARLDDVVADVLQFTADDRAAMDADFAECEPPTEGPWSPGYGEPTPDAMRREALALFSELFGMAIGRFDVRFAAGSLPAPAPRASALDPLPVAPSPLLDEVPAGYPLPLATPQLLVDDPGHPHDVVAALRRVLDLVWPGQAAEREAELADALGVASLREHVRRGFWADHLRRYAKARRQAPVYWYLATPSARYGIFLHHPDLDRDTLFRLLHDHVEPKLQHGELRATRLERELGERATAAERRALDEQQSLVVELRAFRDELRRVAPFWAPSPHDGVPVSFAPLWRLVPHQREWQRTLRETWDALCDEQYEWSALAMELWPGRVLRACARDRSLAIAHGVEEIFWEEREPGRWTQRRPPLRPLEELVRGRANAAVEAALRAFRDAPTAGGGAPRGRRRRSAA